MMMFGWWMYFCSVYADAYICTLEKTMIDSFWNALGHRLFCFCLVL